MIRRLRISNVIVANMTLFLATPLSLASKGVWGELLGVGDFYYELGIQIIDVCLSTRALNGGLMELSEVQRRVQRMRGLRDPTNTSNKPLPNIPYNSNSHINNLANKWATMTNKDSNGMEVTEDDVLRSIKTLAPLGSGFQVLQIGEKKMVSSVPRELNRDQSIVLGLVQVSSNDGLGYTVYSRALHTWRIILTPAFLSL